MKRKKKREKGFSRYYWLYFALVTVFTVIVGRLLYLQLVMVDEYREKSNTNSYKTVSVNAARGDIVDSNGNVLATSVQSYVLEYSQTDDSDKYFYQTMSKVFEILDSRGIVEEDDFPIVIDDNYNYSYNFKATTEESRKWLELRFKKDRGFDEVVARKLYGEDIKMSSLSKEQEAKIDEALLELDAKAVFETLYKDYKLTKYYALTPQQKRRYLIVKDAIKISRISGDNPVTIANNIDEETAFIFQQQLADLPGVNVDTQPMRYYPEKELGSSFLGYMSSINQWEEEKYTELGYEVSTDTIGVSGIEAAYESYLKGSKGQQRIQINKQGRTVKVLGEVEAYAGDTVQLNLDMNLQKVAEKALEDALKELQEKGKASNDADTTNANRGAVIVMRPTGEILALVSNPGYDPNIFTTPGLLTTDLYNKYFNPDYDTIGREFIKSRGLANKDGILTKNELATLSLEERQELVFERMFPIDSSIEGNTTIRKDEYDVFPKSFYNYASLSLVPPGSTFKPVTALAGLEEGAIHENDLINDTGQYRENNYTGNCWIYNMSHGAHGPINVKQALEVSCNYFFYDVANRLYKNVGSTTEGLNFIAKYAWALGLGVPQGSDLPSSTGIEIAEHFGQVYNYESSKNSLTNTSVNSLADYLKKGIQSKNAIPHYKGIDITQAEETGKGKERQQIVTTNEKKKTLVDVIKSEMKAEERTADIELMPKLEGLINDIINSDENIKATGYTEEDVENMTKAIIQSILDARVEISSPANAYNAAIGQGLNTFTPLQVASYVSTLLNGGVRYETKLVDKIIDSETGEVIEDIQPEIISQTEFKKENIDIIRQGMIEVTNGESGTSAAILKDFPIPNGGKTGTSNIIVQELQAAVGRDAAGLYVGFAPIDNPEIVVCSIVFDGGHGKGNIAKAVYEQYFKEKIKSEHPDYKFTYNVDEEEK